MKFFIFLFIYIFNIVLSNLIPKVETFKNGNVKTITYLKREDNKLIKVKLENYFSCGQLESSVKFKNNQKDGEYISYWENGKMSSSGYFNNDRIYENINSDFKYSYLTPLNFINLINFSVSEETNISELTINNLIKIIIDKNLYKKNHLIQNEIKILLEIFFYKKYKYSKSNKLYKMINYFNKKYSEAIKFNIDLEPIFLEIKTELLNEK